MKNKLLKVSPFPITKLLTLPMPEFFTNFSPNLELSLLPDYHNVTHYLSRFRPQRKICPWEVDGLRVGMEVRI